MTCLGGRFGINCPYSFLNYWNYPSKTGTISKFSRIAKVIYPPISPEPNTWLLVKHNKPTLCIESNVLTAGNYKLARGQLQNNTVNGAMPITINRVIRKIISFLFPNNNKQVSLWQTKNNNKSKNRKKMKKKYLQNPAVSSHCLVLHKRITWGFWTTKYPYMLNRKLTVETLKVTWWKQCCKYDLKTSNN